MTASTNLRFLDGGGEMGRLVRAHDWRKSDLGAAETWPQALRTMVSVVLNARQPMSLAWGEHWILLYNDAYMQIIGGRHPASLGRPILDVWPEFRDRIAPVIEAAFAGKAAGTDDIVLMVRRDERDEELHFSASYTPVRADDVVAGVFCVCTETTARMQRAAEAARQQARTMAALSELTSNLGREVSNILQGVGGGLEIARRRLEQGREADAVAILEQTARSAGQGNALMRRLLTFAVRRRQDVEPVALEAAVLGLVEMIGHTVGPSVTVRTHMQGATRLVSCQPLQLGPVLLNLAVNAREAMPDGGTLTVTAREVRLTDADVAGDDEGKPGDHIELAVTDTGLGMAPEVLQRAIHPFFTTKPLGRGLGLGLAEVYGFVRRAGGVMRLDSAPGQGTTVRLFLPCADADAAAPGPSDDPAPAAGGRTLLLVDDEVPIREMMAETLADMGWRVEEAGDAATALRLAESHTRLDMLVTDLRLPGMDGRALVGLLRGRFPALPVLYVTGSHEPDADLMTEPHTAVILKPFSLATLAVKVRDMTAAATPDALG